jgi:xanthine dehydrogenase molybdopterin-binding subunit B
MNAELIDMYTNAILSSMTSLMGIDIASRVMARAVLYRQDVRLREGCAPRVDPPDVGAPVEHRIDILLRQGGGREQFLERSLIPFQGAQYGDRTHRLLLPDTQDSSDAVTFLTHLVEDIIDRISVGARRMGGLFAQHVSQAFVPDC